MVTIIEHDYIQNPEELQLFKTSWKYIINDLRLFHEYRYDTGKYNKIIEVSDSDSQTKFGTGGSFSRDKAFRYLDSSSANYIAPKLVGSNGLWSSDWLSVKFRTKGVTYTHLEAGDYFKFNVDAIGGVVDSSINWQATNFMVVANRYVAGGSEIIGMLVPGRLTIDLSNDIIALEYIVAVEPTYEEASD